MKSFATLLTFGLSLIGLTQAKGAHKVHCSEELMRVEVALPQVENGTPQIYLDGMKGYPNKNCQPIVKDAALAEFRLSLKDIYECGVTRVVNKITGKKVYYHKIIIEGDADYGKEILSVKCITGNATENHSVMKRDVLPVGFQEPEDLEITTSVIKSAPTPALKVAVRQGGNLISGDLNVSPGTPLSMEIYLDKDSAPVYGLGVTHMQVTDTEAQEETIIYNGCSVDPYLFENFETEDGDFLKAKFKAFKFPDSTYVQFRGTVNVCLDRCNGIECSNGQLGFGRKRREIMQSAMDPNKIFEISMTTFIKVNYDEEADQKTLSEIEHKLKQLKITNQKLARNSRAGNVFESVQDFKTTEMNSNDDSAKVEETLLYKVERTEQMLNSSSKNSLAICSYLVILSVLSYVMNTVL